MFKVHLVTLPSNFLSPRVLAFKNYEKAQEFCDALQKEYPATASKGHWFEVSTLDVYEDDDFKIVKLGTIEDNKLV